MKAEKEQEMQLTEIKPTILRKYIYEYSLICLASCVVFLFLAFNDLNKFIRQNLMEQKAELVKTVEKNTAALEALTKKQDK